MENKTIENSTIIKFDYEGTFSFTVTKVLNEERAKKVYIGKFESNRNDFAPKNCVCDKLYCMKKAKIAFPIDDFNRPQKRHFWDFFSFNGDNIREIIAMNNGAINFNNDIQSGQIDILNNNNGVLSNVYDCITIEPYYQDFNAKDFPSALEKIDCMKQIVAGLKQLMSSELFSSAHITAHRDLKFRNVMVDKKENGEKILRLIDFPSIKTEVDNGSKITFDQTSEGAFSYSNTTPEDVIEEYPVTEKNDVFALGCMLLEIFGVCSFEKIENPLYILFKKSNLDIEDKEACAKFYMELQNKYPFEGIKEKNWLESFLENHNIYINWDNIDSCKKEIKELFRAATAINPINRVSLNQFEEGLNKIEMTLSRAPQSKPKGMRKEIFLIDTKDLVSHRFVYISRIQEIMKGKWWDIEPVIIGFDWVDNNTVLQPIGTLVSLSDESICYSTELSSAVAKLNSTSASYKSCLKGCLFEVIKYMEGTNCTSNIHIFTSVPPTEDNMCPFQYADEDDFNEIKSFTAREIVGEELNVIVYTYQGRTEAWYKPVFFNASYQTTEDSKKTEAENIQQTQEQSQSKQTEDKPEIKIIISGGVSEPVKKTNVNPVNNEKSESVKKIGNEFKKAVSSACEKISKKISQLKTDSDTEDDNDDGTVENE